MKCIVVTPNNRGTLRIKEIEKPTIDENEVLIQTMYVGIDGTDREINNALYGQSPENSDYLILGHEALGKIIKVGKRIKNFNVGDLVVPTVRRPDDCEYCLSGEPDMCIKGNYKERGIKALHGFMSEYFKESPEWLVKVPEKFKEIVVLLEPLSIVEKGVRISWNAQKRMNWKPKNCLVTGLGPLGILAAAVLKMMNLNVWVYSLENKSDSKVKNLQTMNIGYISGSEMKYEEITKKLGLDFDFIFEATGNSIIAMKSMDLIGINGAVCLTGVTGGHKKITLCADCLNMRLVLGNRLILGSVNANIIDFRSGLDHMEEITSKYPDYLKKIITKQLGYSEIDLIKEEFEKPVGTKTIISFKKFDA